MQGIIERSDRLRDYVFFVIFGQSQATHEFDEGIFPEGVLPWPGASMMVVPFWFLAAYAWALAAVDIDVGIGDLVHETCPRCESKPGRLLPELCPCMEAFDELTILAATKGQEKRYSKLVNVARGMSKPFVVHVPAEWHRAKMSEVACSSHLGYLHRPSYIELLGHHDRTQGTLLKTPHLQGKESVTPGSLTQ